MSGAAGVGRDEAQSNVAERFTRIMRASTSPWGVLTDPPVVCAAMAALVVPAAILLRLDLLSPAWLLWALAATPPLAALMVNLALRGAREQVIAWLAAQPFAIENMNALLDGVGQSVLVRFAGEPPTREALNALLEAVHEDCFALDFARDEPEVEVRIGVPDSKLNPAAAHHRRYRRLRQLVEQALLPLHQDHPIAWARVT